LILLLASLLLALGFVHTAFNWAGVMVTVIGIYFWMCDPTTRQPK
jgi:hypothetical protein